MGLIVGRIENLLQVTVGFACALIGLGAPQGAYASWRGPMRWWGGGGRCGRNRHVYARADRVFIKIV